MCLIAFAIDTEPGGSLLIAANRDEFLDRPTAPLHRWQLSGGTEVIAGRDLRDGGTWLGVNTRGRVAMLTNVRDAQPGPGRQSRGELPTRWLQGQLDGQAMADSIDPAAYGGFNLVLGDVHTGVWTWLGNRDPAHPHAAHDMAARQAAQLHVRQLGTGVYGLSNATLDTPWPKTQQLKAAVQASSPHAHASAEPAHWLGPLSRALADDRQAPPSALPATGVPLDLERGLSSPFIHMPERGYGTRSSLILRATRDASAPAAGTAGRGRWTVHMHEWTHHPAAPPSAVAGGLPQAQPAAVQPISDGWALEDAHSETLHW